MEQLIEYIAKGLVVHPDEVEIRHTTEGTSDLYELNVAGEDMGRVIGRQGQTARAMRAVVRAASARIGRRAHLDIVD